MVRMVRVQRDETIHEETRGSTLVAFVGHLLATIAGIFQRYAGKSGMLYSAARPR